jgi:hypothetical protein
MESKKINQLATSVSPQTSDLTIIGDPITGVSKKITLLQIANLFATTGTVTSVAVTETGDALTITGSPITSAGTINIGFAGDATQYVRGDGALADFPTSTGGGSSVSYYLNSSVSQGTIGGVAYRELSKDPIAGAGTDITISANGYIASYITDANDPALLEVPAGNFNCEFYFAVNSNNHDPYVYAEVYKYDGTTFTLIGSSQSVPEYLTNGTTLSPYYFAVPVATAALTITDRLAIRIYVNVDGRTVTLHTENNHLCQVVTTFSKGLTSLNNLTRQVQFLATGTSGTDFAISSSTATHTFNLPVASATNTGKLSSTDWSTFNAKQPAGNYVTLDTTQTITGLKAFNTPVIFNNALNLTFGAPVTALGNSFAIYASKISNYSILSLYDADTAKYSQLNFDNTTNRTYTFPNASGTIALTSNLSSYVPYTGATANVTLGLFDLYAQNILATDTSGNWLSALTRDGGTAIGVLALKSGGFTNYLQPITTVSSARTWTLPDASGTIALTSNINYPVTSVFGRTGAVVAASGDYTTTQVTEGTNLYFTDARSRAALSFVAGSGAYNSTTGVITIPTNNDQITNGAGYITSSALSSYLPLTGGTLTGALNGTSAVFSSTVQASAYRLTGMTAGSGALYWSSDRVTLANYNASGTVSIETGGGTAALTLAANQAATFSGTITTNTSIAADNNLRVQNSTNAYASAINLIANNDDGARYNYINSSTNGGSTHWQIGGGSIANTMFLYTGGSPRMIITSGGNVGIGTSAPLSFTSYTTTQISNTAGGGLFVESTTGGIIGQIVADNGYAGGAAVNIGSRSNHPTVFSTNNTERMRITSGGTVGIGTSSVDSSLSVDIQNRSASSNNVLLRVKNTSASEDVGFVINGINGGVEYDYKIGINTIANTSDLTFSTTQASGYRWYANSVIAMQITSGGQVGINTIDGGVQLAVKSTTTTSSSYPLFLFNSAGTGVFYVRSDSYGYLNTSAWAYGSDRRLKENISYLTESGLEKILKLKPARFDYIDGNKNNIGWIAQDVQEVIEEAINISNEKTGMLALKSDFIVPYLVKAIQEQQAQIEELKAKIK